MTISPNPVQKRLLALLAQDGLLGSTAEEVAAYLVTRGLEELLRSNVIRGRIVEEGRA